MGSDILREIVTVETEIQLNLEVERKRSRELIENVRREVEAAVTKEEERFKESCVTTLEEAKADAKRKAGRIVEEAAARARILKGLDVDSLRDIIIKYIVRILPGECNDS